MKLTATVLALSATAALAGPVNIPTGTCIYSGSILNYKHEVMCAADELSVQAVDSSGNVLASCRVVDPAGPDGVNYILEVPVSTVSSAKSAAIGDSLTCVLLSASGVTNVSPMPLPVVFAANAITNVNIVSAGVTQYSYGDGSVPVADDYVAGLLPLMKYQAGTTEYNAAADWDGDGVSNYDEYVAGTNPFDASDFLRITGVDIRSGKHVITFEYAGGHLYTLKSSLSLTNSWGRTSFSVSGADGKQVAAFSAEGDEETGIGTATIYLAPAADSASVFYRIGVE